GRIHPRSDDIARCAEESARTIRCRFEKDALFLAIAARRETRERHEPHRDGKIPPADAQILCEQIPALQLAPARRCPYRKAYSQCPLRNSTQPRSLRLRSSLRRDGVLQGSQPLPRVSLMTSSFSMAMSWTRSRVSMRCETSAFATGRSAL